jgi:hypothetical protein
VALRDSGNARHRWAWAWRAPATRLHFVASLHCIALQGCNCSALKWRAGRLLAGRRLVHCLLLSAFVRKFGLSLHFPLVFKAFFPANVRVCLLLSARAGQTRTIADIFLLAGEADEPTAASISMPALFRFVPSHSTGSRLHGRGTNRDRQIQARCWALAGFDRAVGHFLRFPLVFRQFVPACGTFRQVLAIRVGLLLLFSAVVLLLGSGAAGRWQVLIDPWAISSGFAWFSDISFPTLAGSGRFWRSLSDSC